MALHKNLRSSNFHFQQVDWIVDASGVVAFPGPFGDAELVNVEMAYKTLTLTFEDHGAIDAVGKKIALHQIFRVECKGTDFFQMETDHLQNVVEDLWILDDFEKAKNFKTYAGKLLMPSTYQSENKFYVFVTPITGIELFAACSSAEISRSI